MKRNLTLFCMLLFLCIPITWAQQQITIQGTVTDTDNEPIIGATIIVKGTSFGTTTDLDGNYTITTNQGAILEFSYVGMQRQEVVVGTNSVINVKLIDGELLDEVVVIGYGTVKKSDLTGAVASVSAKDLQADVARDATSALQGRIPGVAVTNYSGQPGSGMNINIRGISSLTTNTPLYVIDGVYGDINLIDPSDIASLEVLKDASAAAIYGSRAANGVVLITTKTGRRDTSSRVSVNAYTGIQNVSKKLDLMNGPEWVSFLKANTDIDLDAYSQVKNLQGNGTDWQDEVFRTASINKVNMNISGGSKTSSYSTSVGYISQEGTMINTNYNAFNVRSKNQFSFLNDKLRIGESIIAKISRQKRLLNHAYLQQTIRMPSIVPVYDDTRTGGWAAVDDFITNIANPVGDIYANSSQDNNSVRQTELLFNGYLEADLYKGLRYKINLGVTRNHTAQKAFKDVYDFGVSGANELPQLSETMSNTNSWLLENTLNYDNVFGKHTVSGLLGYSAQRNNYRYISAGRQDLPIGTSTINAGSASLQSTGGEAWEHSIVSLFGRAMYSYASRYMVSASVRRDGSSRFADGYRYGTFPSVSAGWNIHNEAFAESIKVAVNELKLRVSYGKLGNQEIGNYLTQSLVRNGINYVHGSTWWQGAMSGVNWVSPEDLTWEETATTNIGLDAMFFHGKLSLTADAFIQTTDGMLLGVNMPSSAGLEGSPTLNAGKVQNKGIEVSLTHRNTVDQVYYSIGVNLSHIKNKLKEVTIGNEQQFSGYSPQGLGTITWAKVGDPIGSFYLIPTDGLFQSAAEVQAHSKDGELIQPNAEPGDMRFVDTNGDGKINATDAVYAGSPFPDLSFGIRLNAEWNGFDAGLFFDGMLGNKIYNFTRYRIEAMDVISNYSKDVLNAWTPTNTNTDMPRYITGDPNENRRVQSDRWLENGSYLRLKTMEIGYTVPKHVLSKIKVERLRVYTAFENLFTITGYKGYTPDLGESDSVMSRSTDHGRYPLSRVCSFGIQLDI